MTRACTHGPQTKEKATVAVMSAAVEGLDHTEPAAKSEDGAIENTSEVIKRLRLIYRKAIEFRVVHSIYESSYFKAHTALSFVHLVLSSSAKSNRLVKQ